MDFALNFLVMLFVFGAALASGGLIRRLLDKLLPPHEEIVRMVENSRQATTSLEKDGYSAEERGEEVPAPPVSGNGS